MMKMKKVLVMMILLNTFQTTKMCPILRMVLHTKIRTDWKVKYWLFGRGIRIYYSMIIPGQDTCCLLMPKKFTYKGKCLVYICQLSCHLLTNYHS